MGFGLGRAVNLAIGRLNRAGAVGMARWNGFVQESSLIWNRLNSARLRPPRAFDQGCSGQWAGALRPAPLRPWWKGFATIEMRFSFD
jgi:hypothetical protein